VSSRVLRAKNICVYTVGGEASLFITLVIMLMLSDILIATHTIGRLSRLKANLSRLKNGG